MGKDPAFLFYPGDWLGGTMHMQRITRACYFDLLMLQFNRGAFTIDEARGCLGSDFDKWNLIEDKFVCENSKYYNERLKNEINKRKAFTDSRKNGAYALHKHMLMENENRNENRNKDRDVKQEEGSGGKDSRSWIIDLVRYTEFTKSWPFPFVSVPDIENEWNKACGLFAPDQILEQLGYAKTYWEKSKTGAQFIGSPINWLRSKIGLNYKAMTSQIRLGGKRPIEERMKDWK